MAATKRRGQMCCVYGCNNCRYDKENKLSVVHFFNIPKRAIMDKKLKDRWCNLIKRQDGKDGFTVTPRTVICHEHFKLSEIIVALNSGRWSLAQNAEPSIFSWCKETSERKPPKERLPLLERKNPDASPLHEFDSEIERKEESSEGSEPLQLTAEKACQTEDSPECSDDPIINEDIATRELIDHSYTPHRKILTECEMLHEKIKYYKEKCDVLESEINELRAVINEFEANQFSLNKISDDKNAMMFYTGFPNIDVFNSFFRYIESKSERLNYWRGKNESGEGKHPNNSTKRGKKRMLSTKEEFFMVLVRLKVGLFVRDISESFGISQGYFSKIFTTWIFSLSRTPIAISISVSEICPTEHANGI